jgi:hypothetical protein
LFNTAYCLILCLFTNNLKIMIRIFYFCLFLCNGRAINYRILIPCYRLPSTVIGSELILGLFFFFLVVLGVLNSECNPRCFWGFLCGQQHKRTFLSLR